MSLYKGNDLIAGTAKLYNTVGNNTDGAMTQKSVTDLITNSKRNVGEIITSAVPLTDAGLHLMDGELLQYGIYHDFIDYIATLVSTYSSLFVTEATWQSTVTTYGSCGKFVYDSTNNTVRLPKISNIVEGTTSVNALGDLVQAGLPNITGAASGVLGSNSKAYPWYNTGGGTGAFSGSSVSSTIVNGANLSLTYTTNAGSISFDASNSNNIYGNSATVQPQTIKVLYYIVVANVAKTDIQVDLDEVATDLNGKVDKAGDTMTGNLGIKNSSPAIVLDNTAITRGTTPSTSQSDIIRFRDVIGQNLGAVYHVRRSDGSMATVLQSYNANGASNATISVGYDTSGNVMSYAPSCDAINSIITTLVNRKEVMSNGLRLKLGNGWIIQAGYDGNGTTHNISLGIAYSDAQSYVAVAIGSSGTAGGIKYAVGTASSFTLTCESSQSVRWLTIGW